MPEHRMFIDGRWVDARSGATRPIIDPFDRSVIAEVAEGGREDSRLAIAAARAAFDRSDWSTSTGAERGALLRALSELVREDREQLARLETQNTGKTLEESRWDMDDVAGIFAYYGQLAAQPMEEEVEAPTESASSRVLREPVGVCGQICPWNYPLLQASWKVAPALAAGCAIVLKPSELTPLSTLRMTELAVDAGLPAGVLNTVLGPGDPVGAELAESTLVDLVSFTGGVETGKRVMVAASSNVKRIALELGGKNPHILFADADLDVAIDHVLGGVFYHAGQICSAGARLMVAEEVHDRVVDALEARIRRIRLGCGLDEGTEMGPLVSAEHRRKVEGYVAIGQQEGARLVVGGARPADPALEAGFFYLPTLFVDCDASMRIVQEEVFGPVITVERFASEEEAVRLANETVYGLSAGFWTRDPERVERVSRALRFGTVWVNDFNVYFAQAPWGGYKQSGLGRELGRVGLEEYTEVKHVYRNRDPRPDGWFGASE